MNIKTKVTVIVILVFIIGLFIGFMLNRIFIQHRIKEAFARINPNRIPAFYERVLQPDKDLSQQIRTVLSKHAKRIRNIRGDYIRQMQKANQALYYELAPFLTPIQRKRFGQRLFKPRKSFQWSNRFTDNRPVIRAIEKDVEFLKEKLSLTEKQTEKVHRILKEFRLPLWIPRIRDDNAKEKIHSNVLKRAQERDRAIKEVLNQEQGKLYDKLRKKIN